MNEKPNAAVAAKKKSSQISELISKYNIYLILVVLIAIFAFAEPMFFTGKNFINLATSESARGILACGVAFCIISRGIDLSLGSVMAVSSVFSAALVQKLTYATLILPNLVHIPAGVAVVAGLAVGTLFGLLNGLLIAYTKIPAFIATLGSQVIARGLALLFTNAYPVPMLREDFTAIGQKNLFSNFPIPGGIPLLDQVPNIVWILALFLLAAYLMLNRMSFGKNVYAIGGNPDAARAAGIKVERTLVIIYIWAAFTAATAGVMVTARSASGIATLGQGYELDAIAAATVGGVSHLGGIGTIVGVLGGILVLGVINNGLLIMGVSPYLQQIIKGVIIVVAVIFDMRKLARKS